MSTNLTIVMYHYVRPIQGSAYPDIRGRELKDFIGQLDYIAQHYSVVSMEQVIAAQAGEAPLPTMPLLLTFDDGYADHYQYAFPELKRRGWSGAFFVPARAVTHGEMLDVNKIHFILASGAPLNEIVARMEQAMQVAGITDTAAYRTQYAVANRFDTAEVIYLKRVLQVALPLELRQQITDQLFAEFVSKDAVGFARQLYMSLPQLQEMQAACMTIGGHGDNHFWLNRLSIAEQEAEIDQSHALLRQVGVKDPFTFCYPYGGYNADTLTILKNRPCAAAVTTVVGLADTRQMLELARLDTNDLPTQSHAPEALWTERARCGIEAA